MKIQNKIVKHKVILDVSPDCAAFSGTPQWVEPATPTPRTGPRSELAICEGIEGPPPK
jgi:hypothetical protein